MFAIGLVCESVTLSKTCLSRRVRPWTSDVDWHARRGVVPQLQGILKQTGLALFAVLPSTIVCNSKWNDCALAGLKELQAKWRHEAAAAAARGCKTYPETTHYHTFPRKKTKKKEEAFPPPNKITFTALPRETRVAKRSFCRQWLYNWPWQCDQSNARY